MVATTATDGSEFSLLDRVDESFGMMLSSIEEARWSVRLEMYIYTSSAIGERFRDSLVRAAKRGVAVKVLIDAFGSITLPDRFWEPLRLAGGEFRWFNPIRLARWGIRNHRKLLVCDELIAFAGGFNIAPEYQGDGVSQGWHDLGVRIQGSLAKVLADSFDRMFATSEFKHQRFIRLRKSSARERVATREGQLLLSGPGRSYHYLKSILLNDLAKADSIRLITAYFLPTRPIRRALTAAAKKGRRVQIILAGKSDVPVSQLASRRFYQGFLRAGIEIFEYQPQVLHAKMFLLNQVVYIGSANLDRRSLYINYELMLRLSNRDLVAKAEEVFETDLRLSKRILLSTWQQSRTFWNKLRENWAFFLLARVDPFIARYQLRNLRSLTLLLVGDNMFSFDCL